MQTEAKSLSYFRVNRIIIPILLGLLVASYLLYDNLTEIRYQKSEPGKGDYIWTDRNNDGVPDKEEFVQVAHGQGTYERMTYKDVLANIKWQKYSLLWIFMSLLMIVIRHATYMWRLRILTDNKLTWKQCLEDIFLWEFASAVTPSVVGGSAVAVFIINKEGISTGKSTAIVMITALLDELYYIIITPLIFIFVSHSLIFPDVSESVLFNSKLGIKGVFIAGYLFILVLTSIIVYAIFFNPHRFKAVLVNIFKLRFLKRWSDKAEQAGNDMIETSLEMKRKPFFFWFKAFGATFLSWTARFWLVNCLIMVFISVHEHFLIYARQLVMWIIILISPTPGSSGIAEFAFTDFFREFIPIGFSAAIALLWRLFSYYPYLFAGFIVLPHWYKRIKKRRQENKISVEES